MDFLSKHAFFFLLPPRFWGKDAGSFAHDVTTVSSSAQPYARTDTPLRIAHSASSQFRLPPSPLPTIHISIVFVREGKPFLPSPVNRAALIVFYIRVVSKWRQKRNIATRARWLGETSAVSSDSRYHSKSRRNENYTVITLEEDYSCLENLLLHLIEYHSL